ncbi:MAG: Gfo/Idh/MocA family protein [Bryobacteraceae bacterium]
MAKAKIGLIGCGLFGESHLQAYGAVREAEVVALFDIDRARAEQRARDFGVPKVCGSLDEICSLAVDAIDVVTPEDDHLEPVLKALAAGKHVFCEKPLATNLADCDTMIDAAQGAGRILMPGHLLRFETKYAMVKDELEAGRLGRIVSMHARRNRTKALLPMYGRTHPAVENSIHDIDLMLWYTGQPVTKVRGYGRRATGGKHSDTFFGVIEFEGGALGVVETIWMIPKAAGIMLNDSFQLVGTEAIADLHLYPGALSYWRESGYEAPDLFYDPRVRGGARGSLRDELAHFCECIVDGKPSTVLRPEDSRRAVQVALALMESDYSGSDVEIRGWR